MRFRRLHLDFGGTRSKTTFVCCGFTPGYTRMYVLGEAVLGGDGASEITSEDVSRTAEEFLCRMHMRYPATPIRYLFCDSEAQYLIHGLRRTLHDSAHPSIRAVSLQNARKLPISERIACEVSLFAQGRVFFVDGETERLRAGLCGAMWDPGKEGDVRLDNFTSDIDILDAFEYAFEGFIKKLR